MSALLAGIELRDLINELGEHRCQEEKLMLLWSFNDLSAQD
jgi:hypothetical protein